MEKAKIIAFYLPQYYPFKENDEWWGAGFTEWTNVAKAKKLFPSHEQPKIPRMLGFYDLRLEETRIDQAKLAGKYGVDGFCYYYYRLNKNLHLMDRPLKEMFDSGKRKIGTLMIHINKKCLLCRSMEMKMIYEIIFLKFLNILRILDI